MSEGCFLVLLPKSQEHNVNKVISFLEENGAYSLNSKTVGGDYIEILSDNVLEIAPNKLVELCQSILDGNEWLRIYENDEYGSESFWYIDLNSRWKIYTNQDEPNARTLKAYRNWHQGLNGISYGVIAKEELTLLEARYGLFDSSNNSIFEPQPPLKKQVGVNSDFIGKNILVPHAGKYWDWYIPDHECLAVKIVQNTQFPPDNLKIEYRRSYIIEGEIGYVWSWEHKGLEIFLFFMFFDESGISQRILRNYESVSIDEAILINFYEEEFEEGFDQPEQWCMDPETDDFLHKPIQNINDFFSQVIFKGRVLSPYWAGLIRRNKRYYLTKYLGDEEDNSCIEILDPDLDQKLRQHVPSLYPTLDRGVCFEPKIKMKNKTEVLELIGARFIEVDEVGNETLIAEWPIKIEVFSEI